MPHNRLQFKGEPKHSGRGAILVEPWGAASERRSAWSSGLRVRVCGSRSSVCVDPA